MLLGVAHKCNLTSIDPPSLRKKSDASSMRLGDCVLSNVAFAIFSRPEGVCCPTAWKRYLGHSGLVFFGHHWPWFGEVWRLNAEAQEHFGLVFASRNLSIVIA